MVIQCNLICFRYCLSHCRLPHWQPFGAWLYVFSSFLFLLYCTLFRVCEWRCFVSYMYAMNFYSICRLSIFRWVACCSFKPCVHVRFDFLVNVWCPCVAVLCYAQSHSKIQCRTVATTHFQHYFITSITVTTPSCTKYTHHPNVPRFCSLMNTTSPSENVKLVRFSYFDETNIKT